MSRIRFSGLTAAFAVLSGTMTGAPASDPPGFGWPFNSPNTHYMTAGFDLDPADTNRADWTGWRSGEATAGNGHAYDGHAGIDTGMPTGTSIQATAAGSVAALRESVPNDDHSDTGNYLILSHPNVGGRSYRSLYWHLQQNGVIPSGTGVSVTKGQQVGFSDNTGNSTGSHLHYEVQLTGTNSVCPFYHGWWESDEFYYGNTRPCLVFLQVNSPDGLNCREGTSTGYNILTSFPNGAMAVATQHNTWWRVFLPLPPAWGREARTLAGALASGYSEAGSWTNNASKAAPPEPSDDANRITLTGSGSRSSSFGATGDAADVATFSFTVPSQRGNYDIYAAWPGDANAANVTYRVTDLSGTHNVVMNQMPAATGSAGSGSKADPYRIRTNPYVVNHTTVGAPDEWNTYGCSSLSMVGPERLYRLDLTVNATVTIDVTHADYPTKDVDIQLLSAANASSCIARDDFTIAETLAPGTYYIAVDTYGANSRATPYTLRVEIDGPQPFANSWVKLGTFSYAAGGSGSVQVRESSVTGRVDAGLPAKVCADAIKIVPRITRRTGWISNSFATRVSTVSNPVPSVVVKTDKTAYGNSEYLEEHVEVPIYASPAAGTSNSSAIVGKAVTGQRFVTEGRAGDWYRVHLTNGTAATTGWMLGDHLIGYKQDQISEVADWSLY